MVSKIAVIALVAIVACPILIGYAMNLTETTETGYKAEGDSVNVTPLLRTSTAYNYAYADVYQMNTDIRFNSIQSLPVYEDYTSSKTSYPLVQTYLPNWTAIGTQPLDSLSLYGIVAQYNHIDYDIGFNVYAADNSLLLSVDNFESLKYDDSSHTIYFTRYNAGTMAGGYYTSTSIDHITFSNSGSFVPTPIHYYLQYKTGNTSYVDFSGGFHFEDYNNTDSARWAIYLPQNTKTTILSVDLDSVTDSSYDMKINALHLVKTTTAGVVSWQAFDMYDNLITDLYYNQSGSNTYQIYTEYNYPNADNKIEIRYVGAWPTFIGESNYYQKYSYEEYGFNQNISFRLNSSSKSPTVRLDLAEFRAFEMPVIENQTYSPGDFKTNPATTITDLQIYGTSLGFGGNTYTVTDGKITIGTHSIPVNNLTFSSVPDGNGAYINKIGNTEISTTANPSTIVFSGQWSASVITTAQESYTYTHTEWTPGQFAWDGMDQNFLMVGLITCLGVFIGLGIYARKSRSGGIIPLMIITGCAAALFFIML